MPPFSRTAAGNHRTAARSWFRALRRAVSWHRRKLAVLAAVAAVLTAISAATPPPAATMSVVVTTRRVPPGATLTNADLDLRKVDPAAIPEQPVTELTGVTGRVAGAALARGQVLTAVDLTVPTAPSRPGRVLMPLRLSEAEVVDLLRVGDRVSVLAALPDSAAAKVVGRDILVVGLPTPADTSRPAAERGSLVLVEVDERTATTLAQASASAQLTVFWA